MELELWVVRGSGNMGELEEQLKSNIPDLLFLMDGFNLCPELVNLQLLAADAKMSIDLALARQGNAGKIFLMESLNEESMRWIEQMEAIHDDPRFTEEGRRASIFVLNDALEIFCKGDDVRRHTFSFDKIMRNHFGYQPLGSDGVKLCRGYHSIQEIHPYERDGQIFIIWPKTANYEMDLDRFIGQDTILITDGPVTKLQIAKARPKLVLSPFPTDKCSSLVLKNGVTMVKLK